MGTHFLFVAQDDPWQDILYAADAGGFCEVPLSLLRRLRKEGEVHKGSDEAERGFQGFQAGLRYIMAGQPNPLLRIGFC